MSMIIGSLLGFFIILLLLEITQNWSVNSTVIEEGDVNKSV